MKTYHEEPYTILPGGLSFGFMKLQLSAELRILSYCVASFGAYNLFLPSHRLSLLGLHADIFSGQWVSCVLWGILPYLLTSAITIPIQPDNNQAECV